MGNWHCVPSSCAEVVYQEYEPPKIRWRYGSEPWQEIKGDDYSFNIPPGKCSDPYYLFGTYFSINTRASGCNVVGYWRTGESRFLGNNNYFNPIVLGNNRVGFNNIGGDWFIYWIDKSQYDSLNISPTATSTQLIALVQTNICQRQTTYGIGYNFVTTHYKRGNNQPDNCGDCTFKVFKNNQVVYQEIRAVCPEVEKIPCRLSEQVKTIEIEKLPYLERVEVVPYQYSAYKLPGVPAPIVQADPIPSQCLNIYNNAIYVIPPSGQGIYSNATPFDSFIAQICSAPGCPPPEYQVICDCNNCESCRSDTCAIECDDHICCYNDYGVSVQSIPKANYCGGNS